MRNLLKGNDIYHELNLKTKVYCNKVYFRGNVKENIFRTLVLIDTLSINILSLYIFRLHLRTKVAVRLML